MVRLKVNVTALSVAPLVRFQFQNGAIKRNSFDIKYRLFAYFNSKMVRLKANEKLNMCFAVSNFNSKMVRLKVVPDRLKTERRKISIPKWCD